MLRIKSLDYIRGLMATAIMIFHYAGWIYGEVGADTLLGKTGLYGVSIFYILSGITLYAVYHQYNFNKKQIGEFALKRIFRIFPLLWLVTATSLILQQYNPGPYLLFINFSGLFGFIDPSAYLCTGTWSIGNELFFYALFPFLIIFLNRSFRLFIFILMASLTVHILLAFRVDEAGEEWWKVYVNPLNQLFFFISGIATGYVAKNFNINKAYAIAGFLMFLALYISYPTPAAHSKLGGGTLRILFTVFSIGITAFFILYNPHLNNVLSGILTFLGEVSYSVYLIHPVIYNVLKEINARFFHFPPEITGILAVAATFISAHLIYRNFELKAIHAGRKLIHSR